MARKTRRQKQRSAARQPALVQARPGTGSPPPPPGAAGIPAAAGGHAPASPEVATPGASSTPAEPVVAEPVAPVAGVETPPATPARRRVERIAPGAPSPAVPGGTRHNPRAQNPRAAKFGSSAAMVAPLDTEDPAIPFDRVPYVPADLRRVGVIAALMVVLILVAWIVVARVTG